FSPASGISQVEREREIHVLIRRRWREFSLGRAVREEAPEAARFGFVTVHRESVVAAAAGMSDMVLASAERTLVPSVIQIKHQRRVRGNCGLQAIGRLPGAIAD